MVIDIRKFSMRLGGLISEHNLHYSDLQTLSGVHAITISKYANNKIQRTRPETYDNVNKLANALDVNPRWLAGEDGHARTLNPPNPAGGGAISKESTEAAPSPSLPSAPSWLKVGDPVYIEAAIVGGGCYSGYSIYRGGTDPQNIFSELPNSLPIKNVTYTKVL